MQVDDILTELSDQLHHLTQKKQFLLSEIDAVQISIKRVQAKRGRLTNQTAYIARLPNEIMGQIFLAGQQGGHEPQGCRISQGGRRSLPFELLVSHTTSHWRDLAISTPLLWTHIVSWSQARREAELDRVSTYLARSKACPIDIDLILEDDEVTAILGENIVRWRRVYIETLCQYDLEKILSLIRHSSAPVLQQISVCPEHHLRDMLAPGFPWDVFTGGAPALTFVRLSGVAIQCLQAPLHTVTTLLLETMPNELKITFARFCEIIVAAPSLVNLSLCGVVVESWPTVDHPTFHMPTLLSLRVKSGQAMLYNLLSAIHAPALEYLIIADCSDEDPDGPSWETMESPPYDPKFPKLHSLTLIDCHFIYRNCKSLFRKIPTITQLSLRGSANVEILKGLGDNCQLSYNLPWTQLHTLTIERLETIQESLLCSSVLSGRKQLGHPISVLRLESKLRNKFKRKGRLEWMQKIVSVEKWYAYDPEPWPPGIDFVDIHDVFP